MFVNLHMHQWIPRKEWWCPVDDAIWAKQDHARVNDRVLDMKGVLYALKDAKRRTDEKFWTFQLLKVETSNSEDFREQWFFRHNSRTNTSSRRPRSTSTPPGARTEPRKVGRAAGPL